MDSDKLLFKPDFAEARSRWEAFWQGEIIGRPCIAVTAPKDGSVRPAGPEYPVAVGSDYAAAARRFDQRAAATYYGAEVIPYWEPEFGPDQFAGFLGARLEAGPGTSWAEAFVQDWEAVSPLTLDRGRRVLDELVKAIREAAEVAAGRWLVGMNDLHTHLDALLAIRGGEKLCLDLMDTPELIESRLAEVRRLFPEVYERLHSAANMPRWGSIGWAPFYCRGRFCTLQCDFIYLIGPEMFRRFALPGIEEEASYVDRSVFHLDGPACLIHLDDILAIHRIDVIQWVPGEGNPPHAAWVELFQKIQKAGKGLEIHCSAEEVKILHRSLRPEKVLYCVEAGSPRAAANLIEWLRLHT